MDSALGTFHALITVDTVWGLGVGLVGAAVVLFLVLCFFVPAMAARWPRVAAAAWPYPLALTAVLVACILLLALAAGTSWFWKHQSHLWESLRAQPGLRGRIEFLDWLWPWLPVVLLYGTLLWAAARFLTRSVFHLVTIALLGCAFLGVVFHTEPANPPSPSRTDACPFSHQTVCDVYWEPSRARLMLPQSGPSSFVEVIQQRLATRVIGPTLHQHVPRADFITLSILAVGLLLAYRALDSLNARQSPHHVEVGPIFATNTRPATMGASKNAKSSARGSEASEGEGSRVRRDDLERYMREMIRRNSPHTASRIPGGALVYLQDLLERAPDTGHLSWMMRAAALVMRVLTQPSGIRLTGAVVQEGGKEGLQFELTNLRTHGIELVRTYFKEDLKTSARLAAYSAVETALELNPTLPDWLYWREQTGQAIEAYWNGRDKFKDPPFRIVPFDQDKLEEACTQFRIAAKHSHSNGLARLQYGQAHEALGWYARAAQIYLEFLERHPRMVVARYRLALVCSYIDRWAEPHLREPWYPNPNVAEDWPKTPDQKSFLQTTLLLSMFSNSEMLTKKERQGMETFFIRDKGRLRKRADGTFEITAMRKWFLDVAERQLHYLQRAMCWDVLWWYVSDTRYRRRLAMTMLWPPRRLRSLRQSVRLSRCCVHLRQCLLQRPESTANELDQLALGLQRGERPGLLRPGWLMARSRSEERACVRQAEGIAREACSRHRRRTLSWGSVHYNLACFYALCITPGLDKHSPLGKEPPIDSDDPAYDFWARQAIEHLGRSMRDPNGPISKGSWWWLQRDPDLRALRRHLRYVRWKDWVNLPEFGPRQASSPPHSWLGRIRRAWRIESARAGWS